MTSYQLYITVQHENAPRAGAGSWILSRSVLERGVNKFCADQVPGGHRGCSPSGVRSLTVALGSLQNRTGLGGGDFGSILQKDSCRGPGCSVTVCVCGKCVFVSCASPEERIFTAWVEEGRLTVLGLRTFCLPEPLFYRHQKTIFREQVSSPAPCEGSYVGNLCDIRKTSRPWHTCCSGSHII